MPQPKLRFLDTALVERIIAEAHEILQNPGVKVHNQEALQLLADGGARVDPRTQVACIPPGLVQKALETAPSSFALYDARGNLAVRYESDHVHFDPGSAAIFVLDPKTGQHRQPVTADLVRHLKIAEGLEALDAVSTAIVCADVPEEMADLYRLYLVLLYARKPVVTGAFRIDTWPIMKDLLVAEAGSLEALQARPRAIFDVCPSPPLLWSEITCQNLIDCARHGIPAELVSMPLTGANAPVTLAGALVQHTAESLSGVVIHQLAGPGRPIVYGGSPAAFDMRYGTTPMGAIETMMIDCAYAQIGKHLGLPTHAYLGLSDAKLVDAQTGLESALGTALAALAGINMISGAGMLDFESCQSEEKLVIDAEIIGMARRLVRGLEAHEEPLAMTLMREVGHRGDFMSTAHTLRWFRQELFIPSPVIDRASRRAWGEQGAKSAGQRARQRAEELIATYQPKELAPEMERELTGIVTGVARRLGLESLPDRSSTTRRTPV